MIVQQETWTKIFYKCSKGQHEILKGGRMLALSCLEFGRSCSCLGVNACLPISTLVGVWLAPSVLQSSMCRVPYRIFRKESDA